MFVRLIVCVPVAPTATFPKLTLLELGVSTPDASELGFVAAELYPMQLVRVMLPAMTRKMGISAIKLPSQRLLVASQWVRVRVFITHTA